MKECSAPVFRREAFSLGVEKLIFQSGGHGHQTSIASDVSQHASFQTLPRKNFSTGGCGLPRLFLGFDM